MLLTLTAGSEPFPSLQRGRLSTLQVNLGYRCNQSCRHCHVDAGPWRTEMMADALMQLIPQAVRTQRISCLDLTGGAPELHPGFRKLVRQVRADGVDVIDRCNLTILSEPGQEDLALFLADQGVRVIASLPCYSESNVDQQRGEGVFERSISGLRQLNALGYGNGDGRLELHLVYNPQGPSLPPAQAPLEEAYKKELAVLGIRFDRLLTLANMPIKRFARDLALRGELERYERLLEAAHNPANASAVMCRELLSVDWQGNLYDCDFNQQLEMPLSGRIRRLEDLVLDDTVVTGQVIHTDRHCFGCTAGAGSSCGGALQG